MLGSARGEKAYREHSHLLEKPRRHPPSTYFAPLTAQASSVSSERCDPPWKNKLKLFFTTEFCLPTPKACLLAHCPPSADLVPTEQT